MKAEFGKHVSVHYTLTGWEAPEEGQQPEIEDIEKTAEGKPLEFIFGVGMLLPDFEAQIVGKEPGDAFDFVLTPAQAYGEYDETRVMQIPIAKEDLRKGGFPKEFIAVGAQVPLQNPEGEMIQSEIVKITDKEVICEVNGNAPLAGMFLHFVGTVHNVREATEQDKLAYMRMMTGQFEGGCGGGGCHGGGCGGCQGGNCEGNCEGGCEGGCGNCK